MATPDQYQRDDFRLETTFTDRGKNYVRQLAAAVAAILVIVIILVTTTDFAAYLLPMDDSYLQVLIPAAADGSEALALKTLEHEINGSTLTVYGTVGNRTNFPLSGIMVVVQAQDQYGFPADTAEVPLELTEIPSDGEAPFRLVMELDNPPAGYSLNFRIADGPKVPHIDDRANTYGIPPQ